MLVEEEEEEEAHQQRAVKVQFSPQVSMSY